jgi:cytochrome c-type biogenesis protein CcmH/NrfF
VEFIEVEVDFEVDGAVLRNVKVLRCPICQEEQFTPEQQKAIAERLRNKTEP